MYLPGTRVKIDMNTLDKCGCAVLSCIEDYPDGVFIVRSYYDESEYQSLPRLIYYRIEAETRKQGYPLDTYTYDIREHNLISLEELRDIKLNKILE